MTFFNFSPQHWQLIALANAEGLLADTVQQDALSIVSDKLLGSTQLGIKTLDPLDADYDANYLPEREINGKSAKGFNYHQGPEWLWPVGYYFSSYMHLHRCSYPESFKWVLGRMYNHRLLMETTASSALPELTNENGKPGMSLFVFYA